MGEELRFNHKRICDNCWTYELTVMPSVTFVIDRYVCLSVGRFG